MQTLHGGTRCLQLLLLSRLRQSNVQGIRWTSLTRRRARKLAAGCTGRMNLTVLGAAEGTLHWRQSELGRCRPHVSDRCFTRIILFPFTFDPVFDIVRILVLCKVL